MSCLTWSTCKAEMSQVSQRYSKVLKGSPQACQIKKTAVLDGYTLTLKGDSLGDPIFCYKSNAWRELFWSTFWSQKVPLERHDSFMCKWQYSLFAQKGDNWRINWKNKTKNWRTERTPTRDDRIPCYCYTSIVDVSLLSWLSRLHSCATYVTCYACKISQCLPH